jgi:hypothetical protein
VLTPAAEILFGHFTSIDASVSHICVTDQQSVYYWGDNPFYANGTTDITDGVPVKVAGL